MLQRIVMLVIWLNWNKRKDRKVLTRRHKYSFASSLPFHPNQEIRVVYPHGKSMKCSFTLLDSTLMCSECIGEPHGFRNCRENKNGYLLYILYTSGSGVLPQDATTIGSRTKAHAFWVCSYQILCAMIRSSQAQKPPIPDPKVKSWSGNRSSDRGTEQRTPLAGRRLSPSARLRFCIETRYWDRDIETVPPRCTALSARGIFDSC